MAVSYFWCWVVLHHPNSWISVIIGSIAPAVWSFDTSSVGWRLLMQAASLATFFAWILLASDYLKNTVYISCINSRCFLEGIICTAIKFLHCTGSASILSIMQYFRIRFIKYIANFWGYILMVMHIIRKLFSFTSKLFVMTI